MTLLLSSIIPSFLETRPKSEPCMLIENSTINITIWNTSYFIYAGLTTAIMANTIDAAPRSPDQETNSCWRREQRKGVNNANTAAGLATNVKNTAIASAYGRIAGSCDGNASKPNRKKISICISPVIPSKKCTSDFLLCNGWFPNMIPAMYTLK